MLASFALRHLCPILSRDKHSLEFVVTLLETLRWRFNFRFSSRNFTDRSAIDCNG